MIGSQSSCFLGIFTIYFIFFFLLPLPNTTLASPSRFLCGRDQRDALLEVKEEFPIHTDHDSDVTTISWNKSVDCCSWDGVKCDANFGEVISLNLVSNFANTSLKSSSGLFKLQHLTHLDLSDCYLQGEIPSSIGNLSHLTFLDLSSNYLVGEIPASIGNLNNLRYMKLSGNDLIGNIPTSFANFTKLSVLNLNANQFRGGDIVIANLTSLSEIDLSYNHFKSSITADLSGLHNLEQFLGDHNSFVGLFPSSLLMISSLVEIDLSQNQFVGHIDFGNTSSSSKLGALDVGFNDFDGPIPKSISKLRNINDLDLSHNNFGGRVPSPISELANLFALFLSHNNFGGRVPSSIGKLRNLQYLDLSHNNFGGRVSSSISELANLVPSSIGKLRNLQYLDLSGNNFGGRVPSSIGKLQNLNDLNLSHNNFGGRVPSSISKLVNLSSLDLSYNKLEGQVPHFTWRSSPKYNKLEGQRNLSYGKSMSRTCSLDLSHNLFSSFGKSVELDDESSFMELYMDLDLSSNSLQGPIPQWICNFTTLKFLDLSNNQITGTIPQCLKNSSILNLQNNSLSGFLPDFCMDGAQLRSLDVSHNNLKGKLPKSLLNCTHMEFLNVRGNKIKDTFPFWLGSLPRLNILVLQSNAFYGPVYNPSMYLGFSSVRIIDISNNNFDGSLPQDYFANWTEMSLVWDPLWRIKYDRRYTNIGRGPMYMGEEYINKKRAYSIDMVYKGVDTDFVRIFKALKAIDFSGNRFYGDIPRSIGLLSELRLLNLAGNAFTGSIPPFLANITNLETLDLSRNNLSGEIPQGLGNLSFLSYINFSNNHLQGLVPQSTQFVTQKCSSFMGNPGLYGLEKICKDIHAPIPTSQQPKESSSEPVVNWIAAAIAFGPGVFCGLVIGHIFTSYKHEWFIAR